ncbi:MAG: UTP--glucose-1-phosphate uridylyltransferase GalU [Halanaerobium sp.]|nr:UTP--glucose-1-phosphate uridylyltransferase GalU [Halanaerobium sp.]
MKITKAVIPAAGLGTRFLPVTKAVPKEMLPIVDKPTLQYIIEELVNSGIKDILIITGRGKEAIADHFDHIFELEASLKERDKSDLLAKIDGLVEMANIHFVRQPEPLGLGHAIGFARYHVGNEPFVVVLGDDIVDAERPVVKQMLEAYEEHRGCILGVQRVPWDSVHKYGILNADNISENVYKVFDLEEKPAREVAASNLAILGRYIFPPEIFSIIDRTPRGRGGEIQITDSIRLLNKQQPVYAYEFSGRRFDVGQQVGFLQANLHYALKRPDLKEKMMEYIHQLRE